MAESDASVPVIALTAALGAIFLLIALLFNVFKQDKSKSQSDGNQAQGDDVTGKEKATNDKGNIKKGKSSKTTKKAAPHVPFSHPWLAGTLKGHSNRIVSIDFSPNGKYLISASEDRALMLWSVKEFQQREHKYIRGNVELDSVTLLAFSPDSKAFIGILDNENAVRIFRMGKKDDGSHSITISGALTFPRKHDVDIIGVGISSSGRFIMTCGSNTTIIIWDIKGEVLAVIETHLMNNTCGKLSSCGRFVGASGFTSDVKVWEVCFDKGGNFKEVKRAFELKGHTAGVYSFDFNNDSRRMASVSKDKTWKLWDTDVVYEQGQDPRLLFTGSVSFSDPMLMALSPDGTTAAIGCGKSIALWDCDSETEEALLENVHAESMSSLKFDISGRYVVTSGSKHIQVIHNVIGQKSAIRDLEEKLKSATGPGMKDRIRQQLTNAKEALDAVLSGANGHAEAK